MSEDAVNRAYLLLGSNIRPEENLPAAVRELERHGLLVAVSPVYESKPVGSANQANFLNAAVLLETPLSARALRFEVIAGIELKLGRVRDPQNKNAPRTIDIDLALFNREVIDAPELQIPDPNLCQRAFVARPLADADPGYVHPLAGRTLAELAAEAERRGPSLRPRPDVQLIETAG